jgi:hypothetical protein
MGAHGEVVLEERLCSDIWRKASNVALGLSVSETAHSAEAADEKIINHLCFRASESLVSHSPLMESQDNKQRQPYTGHLQLQKPPSKPV